MQDTRNIVESLEIWSNITQKWMIPPKKILSVYTEDRLQNIISETNQLQATQKVF